MLADESRVIRQGKMQHVVQQGVEDEVDGNGEEPLASDAPGQIAHPAESPVKSTAAGIASAMACDTHHSRLPLR